MGKMRAHPRVPGCSNEVVGLRGPGGPRGLEGALRLFSGKLRPGDNAPPGRAAWRVSALRNALDREEQTPLGLRPQAEPDLGVGAGGGKGRRGNGR